MSRSYLTTLKLTEIANKDVPFDYEATNAMEKESNCEIVIADAAYRVHFIKPGCCSLKLHFKEKDY